MSLLADEREFGARLGGKPKAALLDLRLSVVHGREIRARCDAENECAVGGFDDAMIEGQFTTRSRHLGSYKTDARERPVPSKVDFRIGLASVFGAIDATEAPSSNESSASGTASPSRSPGTNTVRFKTVTQHRSI